MPEIEGRQKNADCGDRYQVGDEGKGRVIDLLAERADIVVRYQGGNNAGHTVVTKQGKFILNLLPSGILHPNVVCVLADGMVVDLEHLSNEIADIRGKGVSVTPQNFKLSARATISMPWHRIQDDLEEERLAQSGVAFGSTRRGIAYAYSDKYRKKTLRLGDLLHLDEPYIQVRLKTMLEAKIWNWQAAIIRANVLSGPACLSARSRQRSFYPISVIPEIIWIQRYRQENRWFWKRSLALCVILTMAFSPTLPVLQRLRPIGEVGAGIPGVQPDHVVGVLKAYSTCVGAGRICGRERYA